MASAGRLMALGLSAALAAELGTDEDTGVTATGSSATDAYVLKAALTTFSTVSSSTGALLPTPMGKPIYAILNSGAQALTVYPPTGQTVNGTTSFSVTNAKTAIFIPRDGVNGWFAFLSA